MPYFGLDLSVNSRILWDTWSVEWRLSGWLPSESPDVAFRNHALVG